MQELVKNIENWAEERGLIDIELAPKQYLKTLEEIGETARAILKDDKEQIVDGIGDIAVCVIVLAKQLGVKISSQINTNLEYPLENPPELFSFLFLVINTSNVSYQVLGILSDIAKTQGFTLEFCLQSAWNEIKDRKGKLINGTFVKES